MRPRVEHVGCPAEESFACRRFSGVAFDCPWHVHAEVEVLLIDAGAGRRLVGDALGRFAPGDLYLFGPNLPHLFYSDPPEPMSGASTSRYVQFRLDCFGPDFFDHKELRGVRALMARARRGLYLGSQSADSETARLVGDTFAADGVRRVACLLTLLGHLADLPDQPLAGPGFELAPAETAADHPDGRRLGRAIDHIHRHMTDPLDLPRVARLAGLSPGGFARAFRRQYGRSFTDFVIDLRLCEACRLLIETDLPVLDVCYAAGFANLSNFNRQFLKRRGTTPRLFRRSVVTTAGRPV